jgi:hypothetical protein
MNALASGLTGAAALTAAHETLRRLVPDAPRMDVMGARALTSIYREWGCEPPDGQRLYAATLLSDLISNGVYYAAVAAGSRRRAWSRAAVFGLAAGLGAVYLPERLGLGRPPHADSRRNRALTVALYLAGALVAAGAAQRASREVDDNHPVVGYDRRWLRRPRPTRRLR